MVKARRPARGPKQDARRERWRELASRAGGTFVPGKRSFSDVVELDHVGWTVSVGTYVVNNGGSTAIYTRARAFPDGWRGLRLTVRKRGWLDRLVTALGYAGSPPIAPSLLERFVVRGKPASRVPSMFADRTLSEALLRAPSARLTVGRPERKERRKRGHGVAEVSCRIYGVETDVDKLVCLVDVVSATLDALHRIGEVHGGG